jgi:hypothetical protein
MRWSNMAHIFWALTLSTGAICADFYTSIRPIIETKCNHCHSGKGVSFPFGDLDTSYALGPAMANAVAARRMPPWMAAPGHQNYQHDMSLSASQVAAFANWATSGFPKGDRSKYVESRAMVPEFKPTITLKVEGSAAFLPNQAVRDDYRCFLLDWPVKTPMYIRGLELKPGNLKIAHHAVVYAVSGKYAAQLRAMDAAEPGVGYRCFGGPLPDRFGDLAQANAFEQRFPNAIKNVQENQFWLTHWAPGMDGYNLPADTGILINPGTLLIVQMHYFTGFAQNQKDSGTTLGVQLEKSVKKPGFNWPLSNTAWLNALQNNSLIVPKKQQLTVSAEASFDGLDKYISALAGLPLNKIKGLELHSTNVHMHLIGAAGRVTLTAPAGSSEILLDIPKYDFGWQRDYVLVQPKIIKTSELQKWKLKVQCTFANPTDTPVFGGYGSNQEMCYNFSFISVER